MVAVTAAGRATAAELAGRGKLLLFLFPSSSLGLGDGDSGPAVDGRKGDRQPDSGDFLGEILVFCGI